MAAGAADGRRGEHGFARLERVVSALVDRFQGAQGQVASLRRELAERDRRLQDQAREIRSLNQRHQDVAKRLDELIAELDRLDVQLAGGAASADGTTGTSPRR